MKYEKPSIEIMFLERADVVTASDGIAGPGGYVDGSEMFG